ncbi:hypothetical protein [Pseudoclavibacter sp. RFBG4]|uniref:hypothetical protein n=1 Tax=Pseudoclavibacter sp. RFBG4 TaxID=2080575 RepID=UPI0011AFD6DA|nr:hypothetical protein [Pseudoclavibacter sp. RFBG4]
MKQPTASAAGPWLFRERHLLGAQTTTSRSGTLIMRTTAFIDKLGNAGTIDDQIIMAVLGHGLMGLPELAVATVLDIITRGTSPVAPQVSLRVRINVGGESMPIEPHDVIVLSAAAGAPVQPEPAAMNCEVGRAQNSCQRTDRHCAACPAQAQE